MALTKAQLVDMNANELILDLDADTSLHASTDDQIDIKIGGADDFRFTANTFTALAGSTITGPTIVGSTSVQTPLIEFTDGDDAMTIADGGVVTFAQAPVFPDGSLAVVDLDIDGATDIGAAIVDADLFIVDDGAGGTNRKTTASRLKTYIGASNTPYFWGRNGTTQAINDNTATKLNATTERVDSDGKYASSRFTPTVAGNYFIFGGAYLNSEANANLEIAQVMIYKNGSVISGAFAEINYKTNPIFQGVYSISTIIDLDDNDYVELYGQIEASDGTGGISQAGTFFGGYKLI